MQTAPLTSPMEGQPSMTTTTISGLGSSKSTSFGIRKLICLQVSQKTVFLRPKDLITVLSVQKNAFGRDCVDDHLDLCLDAGLNVEGINAEVAAGQWEFQVFAKGAKRAGDETWLARYLLERTGEKYGYSINWHPKPFGPLDWNGSGMHANFSNGEMRESGKEETFTKICENFGKNIERHISIYGADNDQRLTGDHETQSIDTFSYGVSDRGASIRIPVTTKEDGWIGRLEDRRTASNADPYKVAAAIIQTTKEALA